MADLVTRLLLNSSNFDNNIKKSTQQVQQFQTAGKNIASTLGKFAGYLGVAMTAGEAFNKWIHSSQALGDEWDNTINACKGTIDVFFQSLSTGDWSAFQDGLFSTLSGLKELSALRDSLADAKLTMNFNSKRFEAQFTELEAIIRDKSKTLEERKKAYEQLLTLKADFKVDVVDVAKGNDQTLLKSLQTQYKGLDWQTGDIEKYLSVYNNDFSSRPEVQALKEYKQQLQELEKKQYTYKTYTSSTGLAIPMKEENQEITKKIQLLKAQNQELEKMRILNNDDDADRKQMIQDLEYSYDIRKKAADFDKRSFELQASLNSDSKGATVKVKPVIPEGSLQELDKQIAAKKTELNLAISNEDRIRINQELEALTEKKRVIEFQYKYPKAPSVSISTPSLASMAGDPLKAMKDLKIKSPIKKQDVSVANDYVDSLNAIASAMGSISTMTEDSAAAWITWSANLLTAIAAAIPAISTLISAKTAEAGASAAASAAQTPVVGWLLAGAAVASVLAAIATLPSFSTGGIYAGNQTIGDLNLARVNAGEMILNNRQQRNLFNLLNSNGINEGTTGSQVEFKIKGKELVGVLNNYSKRTSKI